MEFDNFTVHGEIASARLPCAMLEVGMVGTGLRNPFRVSLVLLFSKVSSVSSTHKPPLRTTPKTRRERGFQSVVVMEQMWEISLKSEP